MQRRPVGRYSRPTGRDSTEKLNSYVCHIKCHPVKLNAVVEYNCLVFSRTENVIIDLKREVVSCTTAGRYRIVSLGPIRDDNWVTRIKLHGNRPGNTLPAGKILTPLWALFIPGTSIIAALAVVLVHSASATSHVGTISLRIGLSFLCAGLPR